MISLYKCSRCGVEKNRELDFYSRKTRPSPKQPCKQCYSIICTSQEYRDKTKIYRDKKRNIDPRIFCRYQEKSRYKTTKEDIGIKACQLCGSSTALVIDHCHSTNKVRGILCAGCNGALGQLGDTIDSIENVLQYLRKQYP